MICEQREKDAESTREHSESARKFERAPERSESGATLREIRGRAEISREHQRTSGDAESVSELQINPESVKEYQRIPRNF